MLIQPFSKFNLPVINQQKSNVNFGMHTPINHSRLDTISFSGADKISKTIGNAIDSIRNAITRDDEPMVTVEQINKQLGSNYAAVCNPGSILAKRDNGVEGGVHFLLRCIANVEGETKKYPEGKFYSDLVYAYSPNGKNIDMKSLKPVITPQKEGMPGAEFKSGFEDPRITWMDDKYQIICTGYEGEDGTFQSCRWTATKLNDPSTYKYESTIGTKKDDKDFVLHCEPVEKDGKKVYMVYHRPGKLKSMTCTYVEDLRKLDEKHWGEAFEEANLKKNILIPGGKGWMEKVGAGGHPIKTDDGWLHIFHASGIHNNGKKYYCAGVALCDLKEPWKLKAISPYWIMKPATPYETKEGDPLTGEGKAPVPNVIFPEGNELSADGKTVNIYYGAADCAIGHASVPLKDLLDYVKNFDAKGQPVSK